MAVEFFRKSGRGFAPKVSIRKGGQLGLNNGAILRYKINDDDSALLGYDRETRKIHIKIVNSSEEGAKKINITSGNGSISAKAFFDFFDIPYKFTKAYSIVKENEDLVFNLEKIEENNVNSE